MDLSKIPGAISQFNQIFSLDCKDLNNSGTYLKTTLAQIDMYRLKSSIRLDQVYKVNNLFYII